jgi:catechol 2,3-dioxygenase-like lactoylglutathione lyase family enzyme
MLGPRIDIGLVCDDPQPMLAFWTDEAQLPLTHTYEFAPNFTQFRFDALGSRVKINHFGTPRDVPGAGGYEELLIARAGPPQDLLAPGGARVAIAPPGTLGVWQVGLRIAARSLTAHLAFFEQAFGLRAARVAGVALLGLGESVLLLEQRPARQSNLARGVGGWRYLTFEAASVDESYARAIAVGARAIATPTTRGAVRGCLIADPDGNVIELMRGG